MNANPTFRSLVLVVILAPLLALSGCISDDDDSNDVGAGKIFVIPGLNPPFDSISEVAASDEPGGDYDEVLVAGTDYSYDRATESITLTGTLASGGVYLRITGMATVAGRAGSYSVYTYAAESGDRVAANELTSLAVALVADGAAADFDAALGLVENKFGLPAGSAANPVQAAARPAALTSVLAALAPGFANGAFNTSTFDLIALDAGLAEYQECVTLGGLAWDSWHKTGAGGSGLPTDEPVSDYVRCKACHGWDQLGADGGYVRRSRTASRANAGYQDPNNCDLPAAIPGTCTPGRNISSDATFGRGNTVEIPAAGRSWAEGSQVFDSLWGAGAILGNRHPDLGAPEGPTAAQLGCLTAFLNAPEARADRVFAAMDTVANPAIYTPVDTGDVAAGAIYYGANCRSCHGDPGTDSTATTDGLPGTGGMIGYLNADGKFSEFMHKAHWGIPNTSMTRAAMGNPMAGDVANLVAYMQAVPFMEISAAQVVPPVAGIMARGNGNYVLDETGLDYDITVDVANLSGSITGAQFRLGRVGVNGGLFHQIVAPFIDGNAQGTWLNPGAGARAALLAGDVYLVIKTANHADGEIRGQIKLAEGNQSPVAAITVLPAISVALETLVTLNGSGSFDPDSGPSPLGYSWDLESPTGSAASLSNSASVNPTFTADVEGSYRITLVVSDGEADSQPVSVTVTASSGNLLPVAVAGMDRDVDTGSLVILNGSGSSDPDNSPSPLSYAWTLDTVPPGSTAMLANANSVNPSFTPDQEGTYTATLVVNDGADDSQPDSVSITAKAPGGDDFAAGMVKYDAACSGCHAAGSHDTSGGDGGDIKGTGNSLVNDLGNLSGEMNGIILTNEEIRVLKAFLDSPLI